MCLMAIGIVAGIASAAVGAAGAIASANAQASAMEANAAYKQRQAQIEREKGIYEAQREREKAERLLGRQRLSFLTSGVNLSGSAAEVIIGTVSDTELDIEAIKYGSVIREQNYQYEAAMDMMNARETRSAGKIAAVGNAIGGVGTVIKGIG